MDRQVKGKKSAHLQELEEVFEQRTRRFSPFEVLGLHPTPDSQTLEDQEVPDAMVGIGEPSMGVLNPPPPGSLRPIPGEGYIDPGGGLPIPGMGKPPRVVEEYNITTTRGPTPGVGLPGPSLGGVDPPTHEAVRSGGNAQKIGALQFADVVAATQLGSHLGTKARQVLGYLNGIRSIEHD